jgi:hypothetical protein
MRRDLTAHDVRMQDMTSILSSDLPEPCRTARTHPENPLSPCSVESMQLRVSPMLTRRGLNSEDYKHR